MPTRTTDLDAAIMQKRRQQRVNYGIVPYCDRHSEVAMRLCRTIIIGEPYAFKASVNSLEHWRCPMCERCFEPESYGYFSQPPEGTPWRVHADRATPRCNSHGGPMYIGRTADVLELRCPYYGCTLTGGVVSSVGVEGARSVATAVEASGRKPRNQKKAAHEREVFEAFVRAAGLAVDDGSIAPQDPPNPDIRCTIAGEEWCFELARIAAPSVEDLTNARGRKNGVSVDQKKVLLDMLDKKAGKTYACKEHTGLVLYFGASYGSGDTVRYLVECSRQIIETRLAASHFARLDIFDHAKREIVACLVQIDVNRPANSAHQP